MGRIYSHPAIGTDPVVAEVVNEDEDNVWPRKFRCITSKEKDSDEENQVFLHDKTV